MFWSSAILRLHHGYYTIRIRVNYLGQGGEEEFVVASQRIILLFNRFLILFVLVKIKFPKTMSYLT